MFFCLICFSVILWIYIKLSKEIKERMEKWKNKKVEEKNKRVGCPFGCGKNWKGIHTISVNRHVLQKCPNRAGNEHLLVGFYKRAV